MKSTKKAKKGLKMLHNYSIDQESFFGDKSSFNELSLSIHKLEQLVFSDHLPRWSADFIKKCNQSYGDWEKELEERYTKNEKNHWKKYPLYERFRRLIQRERSLIKDYIPQKTLFIGGGPFPISSLIYWEEYGFKSTCIDEDQAACTSASTFIESLGMSDKIEILLEKGQSVDLKDYDLIVISLLALPKKAILGNIREKIKKNIPVICRTSEKARTLLYQPVHQEDLLGWKVSKKATALSDDTISSLLLEQR